jgi:hypothetical protein
MTKRSKWLLWADAILLGLLVLFVSNLALVLPASPAVEFWGIAWPPFVGDRDIRIPDAIAYASFWALWLAAGVLIAFALAAVAVRIKGMVAHRKLGARG